MIWTKNDNDNDSNNGGNGTTCLHLSGCLACLNATSTAKNVVCCIVCSLHEIGSDFGHLGGGLKTKLKVAW